MKTLHIFLNMISETFNMKNYLLFLFIVMGIVFLDLNLSDAQAQTQDSISPVVSIKNHGETSIGNYFLPGEQIEFVGSVIDNTKHTLASGVTTVDLILTCPNGTTTKIASTTLESDSSFSIAMPITNGFGIGDYVVNVSIHKDGRDINGASPAFFFVARGGKQIIKAEGQDFPVYLEGIELQINNLTFNKDTKSLTFDIKKIEGDYAPKGISWINGIPYVNQIFVTFKKPLISAPFHVFVNNQEIQIDNSENQTYYSLDLPLLDSDASGKGHVVLVGTYAVPEFPFSVPVLLIGIVSVIGFYRIRFGK